MLLSDSPLGGKGSRQTEHIRSVVGSHSTRYLPSRVMSCMTIYQSPRMCIKSMYNVYMAVTRFISNNKMYMRYKYPDMYNVYKLTKLILTLTTLLCTRCTRCTRFFYFYVVHVASPRACWPHSARVMSSQSLVISYTYREFGRQCCAPGVYRAA